MNDVSQLVHVLSHKHDTDIFLNVMKKSHSLLSKQYKDNKVKSKGNTNGTGG